MPDPGAMPTYEYRCPNGHIFELVQRMSEPPPAGCEICEQGPLERILYPVAVHFKGSGFYTTDYGRGSRKDAGSKDADSGATSSSDGGTSKGDGGEKQAAKADGGDAKKPAAD